MFCHRLSQEFVDEKNCFHDEIFFVGRKISGRICPFREKNLLLLHTHTHSWMGEQMTRLLTGNFHCQGWCCAYFAKAGRPSLKLWEVRKKLFGMSLTFKLTLKIALWLFVLQFSSFSFFWENFFPGVCCDCARVMEIQGPTDFFGDFIHKFWCFQRAMSCILLAASQNPDRAFYNPSAARKLRAKRRRRVHPQSESEKEKLGSTEKRKTPWESVSWDESHSIFHFPVLYLALCSPSFLQWNISSEFSKKVFISNFWFSRKIVLF